MAFRVKALSDFPSEYCEALEWLAAYTTRKSAFASRFGEYLRFLEFAIPKIDSGEDLTPEESAQFAASHEGAEDLIDIYIGLRGYPDQQTLSENLSRLPKGPARSDARIHDDSRNTIFELALASRFARHGATVSLATHEGADIHVRYQGREFVFECKRPLTRRTFRRNYENANSQLRGRFNPDRPAFGVIAISIGHALNAGQYGAAMFLNAENERSIGEFAVEKQEQLRPEFDRFTVELSKESRISPNLVGRVVDFRFLAIDRSTGRRLQVSDLEVVGYGDGASPLKDLYSLLTLR